MMELHTATVKEDGWYVARVYKLLIEIGGRVAGGLERAGYSLQ